MKTPKILVSLNRKLDEETFLEAVEKAPALVHETYKDIRTKRDVLDAISYVYGATDENKKLNGVVQELQNSTKLVELMKIISELLDYYWNNIKTVTIFPCTSPIFPRFIESNSFLVPYYWPMNWILKVCVHELSHLLYFDKLQGLLNEKVNTEMPSKDWLISEIITPVIVNNKKIQNIVHAEDIFFSPVENIISDEKRIKIEKLFLHEKNLYTFRELALKEIGQE